MGLLLCCCFLIGGAVLPASAAEPDYSDDSVINLDVLNLYHQMSLQSGSTTTDYSKTITYDFFGNDENTIVFNNSNPDFWAINNNTNRLFILSDYVNIKADTHYNVDLFCFNPFAESYLTVYARVFSSGHISDIEIFKSNNLGLSSNSAVNFDFILHSSDLGSNFKIKLLFKISSNANTIGNKDYGYRLSRYITVTDLDSNAKWYIRIINAIKAIPDKLRGFFTELGNKITALGDKIGGFFTDLKNNIVEQFRNLKQWFVQLGDRIQGFFTDLKNKIVEQFNRVGQWFIELKNNLIQGLKDLFIPHETYFEEKKNELDTWATQHLGAVYQGADIAIDFLRQLLTISPKEPAITMPAIEFEFKGVLYHLTDPIHYSFAWVHDTTHPLFYIYKIYRGFVICALFATFGNYLHRKYYEIFAGGGSE